MLVNNDASGHLVDDKWIIVAQHEGFQEAEGAEDHRDRR